MHFYSPYRPGSMTLLLLFAMIKSVVTLFKAPVLEVVAVRLSNESALARARLTRFHKKMVDLTLVLDGCVDYNLPDDESSSGLLELFYDVMFTADRSSNSSRLC